MPKYPAVRYGVSGGALASRTITGPDQEAEGWLPSPHKFRAVTVSEFLHQGHPADKAEVLHKRELRRVKLIFDGVPVEEAESLADESAELSIEGLLSMNADLKYQLQASIAEKERMHSSFEESYTKLKAENEALKSKLSRKVKPGESDQADAAK